MTPLFSATSPLTVTRLSRSHSLVPSGTSHLPRACPWRDAHLDHHIRTIMSPLSAHTLLRLSRSKDGDGDGGEALRDGGGAVGGRVGG